MGDGGTLCGAWLVSSHPSMRSGPQKILAPGSSAPHSLIQAQGACGVLPWTPVSLYLE